MKEVLPTMSKDIWLFGFSIFMFGWLAFPSNASETYFFWYGSSPSSVSWAPFHWEEQDRTSGFAGDTSDLQEGMFYNHTPDAGDDTQLNTSLTFSFTVSPNRGAHHPTVLPRGIGQVSLWVYYDQTYGLGVPGHANSIYLSVLPGADLVKANYLGVEMVAGETNFRVVSKTNPSGEASIAMRPDEWNHLVFTDDGNKTTITINDSASAISLPTGGNLWYINIVAGIVDTDGTIKDGDCMETFYIDDIVCVSGIESGYQFIDVPATTNTVTIDGVINPAEVAGAKVVTWDGSSPERPGVHAQFYGQWALPTPADLTATAYLQNNGEKLYISVDVVDDVISLVQGANWWNDDSTEIYIDHDNSRSTSGAAQISLNAANTFTNADTYADWLVITSKVKNGNTGWQVEAEVDMPARELRQGQTYGFDISINDSDGENETGYQGAQEWLYASYEWAYDNETYWGNIRILSTAVQVEGWEIY